MQHHSQDVHIHFLIVLTRVLLGLLCSANQLLHFPCLILGKGSEKSTDIRFIPQEIQFARLFLLFTATSMLGLVIQALKSNVWFKRKLQRGNHHERWKLTQQVLCQMLQRSRVFPIAISSLRGRKREEVKE